jgi:hypothetical protein
MSTEHEHLTRGSAATRRTCTGGERRARDKSSAGSARAHCQKGRGETHRNMHEAWLFGSSGLGEVPRSPRSAPGPEVRGTGARQVRGRCEAATPGAGHTQRGGRIGKTGSQQPAPTAGAGAAPAPRGEASDRRYARLEDRAGQDCLGKKGKL